MYLLSVLFPGSELDALAVLGGRFRNVGFFEGSHDSDRLSSPDRFLNPADFEESENREPAPLGADFLESDPRVLELLESDPLEVELREAGPLNSELLESEPREVASLESEPREDRLAAASRLDAELREDVPLAGRRAGVSDFG